MRVRRLALFLALLCALLLPRVGFAHPMGNFSVNHYSKIILESDQIRVQYFIDLAEIPTYQELQAGNIKSSPNDAATTRFIAARGAELGRGLSLTMDGKPLLLHLKSSAVIFPPGAGGLPTMKMGFVYEAAYPVTQAQTPATQAQTPARLHYTDNNYEGHTGWKEIVAIASAGSLLKSSVPQVDRSAELSNYPTDLLSSPPQDLDASLEVRLPVLSTAPDSGSNRSIHNSKVFKSVAPGEVTSHHVEAQAGSQPRSPRIVAATPPKPMPDSVASARVLPPPALLKANQQLTPRSRFTELITAQHLSPWFLFTAALIAMALGALHALEPGHGKTIVAAYLVGSRGTATHALLLGLIVTVSHTAGVVALGAVTLYASRYIVPEQLYPWLGVFSGIVIAGIGFYMLLRRLTGTATDHTHAPGDTHFHWFAKNWFATKNANLNDEQPPADVSGKKHVSFTQLFTLGITGGIIPCPAALVVLLSAFALHRIALGFFLIVAFSLGLAAVLVSFGMLMVGARRFMTHLQMDGPLTRQWLPIASAAFITVLGLVLATQALAATHLHPYLSLKLLSSHPFSNFSFFAAFSKERLGPLLFVTGLGLILGMRHSTDADHVVAISTIVSKQRSIRGAALIGSVWGLGHTITIFIVGSLIILFGVKIPPRLGLSMEFCVALMLILLGLLNLTGVMTKITARFSPGGRVEMEGLTESSIRSAGTRDFATHNFVSRTIGRVGFYQCLRPLVIGLVHGLAGSAAVALLVLSTIHDPVWATFYLLIFGAGTMVGMMCMTAAMAVPLTYAGDSFAKLSRYMGIASGMLSLGFGSVLVYQLGFLGGLFTSHPEWTPR